MDFLGTAGAGLLGAGMGLALENHEDQRQIAQQQKLQDMQISGNIQMQDYNYQKQMEMWNNTNYPAQVQQLGKAGLNPALLYGKGGGGGATTGSGAGMGVTGGQAQRGKTNQNY